MTSVTLSTPADCRPSKISIPNNATLGWTIELDTAKDLKVIEAVFDFVREDSTLTIVDRQVAPAPSLPSDGVKPLGEILVETGVVSQTELNQAVSAAESAKLLIEQHIATPKQISDALKLQSEGTPPAKKAETPSIRVDTVKD